jgi:hypothetical protein
MIRLADYLTMTLQAHGDFLREIWTHVQRHGLDQEKIMEAFEAAQEIVAPEANPRKRMERGRNGKPYASIGHAVNAMNLPEALEFYLWSYPYYRSWIESSADLEAPIEDVFDRPEDEVERARAYADAWAKHLIFVDLQESERRVEDALRTFSLDRWLKFRTQALRAVGRRPLQRV